MHFVCVCWPCNGGDTYRLHYLFLVLLVLSPPQTFLRDYSQSAATEVRAFNVHNTTWPFSLHSHSQCYVLQSEIGFRVTDAKKGVSVFWDLPKLEERLEQMRELYQVRLHALTNC